MMFMTAKVDLKKIALVLGAIAAVILALILIFGGNKDVQTTAAAPVSNNEGRIAFLSGFGWEVTASPKESGQVRIPEKSSEVFDRYNQLQKNQGYDLSTYAGKNVMRYVYEINNYPGATAPVYATVLVYKDKVIGGDITDTAAGGKVQGFKKITQGTPSATAVPETQAEESSPSA